MGTLALDPAFSELFTSEPATGAHADEVFDLATAELVAAFGFNPDTAEDVRAWLEPPQGSTCEQLLVRDRGSGELMQWWAAIRDPGGELWHASVRTHPDLAVDLGDQLSRSGYAALLDWMRGRTPPEQRHARVHSGVARGDEAADLRLRAAGFAYARTFWEMTGAGLDPPRPASSVAGLSIAPSRDTITLHRLLDDAFEGHWGVERMGYDDWLALEESEAGYDPDLWVLAELDGIPAAAMILSRRSAADDALYVQELATAAPYRRRGIATALLGHAYDVAAREGYGQVILHVDSSNEHDAPSVYRRAGFEVRCAFNAFARDLFDG